MSRLPDPALQGRFAGCSCPRMILLALPLPTSQWPTAAGRCGCPVGVSTREAFDLADLATRHDWASRTGNIKTLLPFDKTAGSLAAQARFDERHHRLPVDAIAANLVAVGPDREVRLSGQLLDAQIGHALHF